MVTIMNNERVERLIIKSFEARGNDTTICGTKVFPTSIYGTNVSPEYFIIPKSVFGYVITFLKLVTKHFAHVVQKLDS